MSRAEFTRKTKRAAFDRSSGQCECSRIPHVFPNPCGQPFDSKGIRYEHIEPDAIGKKNDLDNCAALRKQCWRYKTDKYDKPVIAKSNRVRDRYIKAKTSRFPMVGGRGTKWKRTFSNGWVLR